MSVPFVAYVTLSDDKPLNPDSFPGSLAFTRNLHLDFDSPVTFFVGENGSGKSTLLEAMAVLARLPISGGGLNESGSNHAFAERSVLAESLRLAFIKQPKDRYFFRAETQAHFASLLEQRRNDPDFGGDPYMRYGGRSLHEMSHGEAFLSIMQNRFEHGLFLMDEPESALSPQRQLALLALMHKLVRSGRSQFFIATHSPILLTFPGATIISFDVGKLERIAIEDTTHFQITRDLLNNPEMYWRHLAKPDPEELQGGEPSDEPKSRSRRF
ncbi:Cobalt import ATP-binding protein CbiO [Rubripirellula tenax]|uniref:Cobalt import ATP-binding protein CbiO n=1 Tax=Rubripirellula tenax TaxID=2528015 RepID=A0A5C6E6Z3_9BACT|nr:AAA family ATPase [Rubripirellula tenax]TWU44722.1 Cobalt import ATP-binding protein CbiO [Rubripirellula tenax]